MPRYKFEDIAFNITEKRMPVPEDKEFEKFSLFVSVIYTD